MTLKEWIQNKLDDDIMLARVFSEELVKNCSDCPVRETCDEKYDAKSSILCENIAFDLLNEEVDE